MAAPDLKWLLKRAVAETIVESELIKLLESGKSLRLKQGFDPSYPDIHLGHVVGLRKLRQLQQLGHRVVLIVGDWTARIGDPSGMSATRPMLSAEEVRTNAETYMKQFFKVVDKDKTEVRWQSEWFDKFRLEDVIRLTSKFTVAQFLAREDFGNRYSSGRPIAITELLYPLLQAYDSIAIEADVEFGGTDQKFNCLVGRELQQIMGQPPQQVFLVPLLIGTDGRKMSKSLGNYIGVDEPPNEIYGKVMSIPDKYDEAQSIQGDFIVDYFELLTDVPDEEIADLKVKMANGSINPMIVKKRLAYEIVAQFHGAQAAREAEEHFTKVHQRREVPEKIKEVELHGSLKLGAAAEVEVERNIPRLLFDAGLVKSLSEARRLLAQGAIEVDGRKVSSNLVKLEDGSVIKVGKRNFLRIVDSAKRKFEVGKS
jgi:tyrosyl-tRNA synthetase